VTSWRDPNWLSYQRTLYREQVAAITVAGVDSRFNTRNYTSSGGNVVSWVDYADASHVLTQPTAGLRVPVPTTSAALLGANAATFSTHWYESNRAASTWRFLHDGTGCEAYAVFVPTTVAAGQRVVWATNTNTAAPGDTGAELFWSATAAVFAIANNGAYPVAFSPAGSIAAGSARAISYQSGTVRTPDAAMSSATALLTQGDYGSAVAAGDPTSTLRLGADPAGARFGVMQWAELFTFQRVLQASERASLMSYFRFEYGIG
jgi:hypothetical protein